MDHFFSIKEKVDHTDRKKTQKGNLTFGGIDAASLFLLFPSTFFDCLSDFSSSFFVEFFSSVREYLPFSSSRSVYSIHNDKILLIKQYVKKPTFSVATATIQYPHSTRKTCKNLHSMWVVDSTNSSSMS